MNLEALVIQKNNQLLLKRAALQESLNARVNTPHFKSFFVAFVIAPFIAGLFTRFSMKPLGALVLPLYRVFISRMLAAARTN